MDKYILFIYSVYFKLVNMLKFYLIFKNILFQHGVV